jgi:hypothetical protein
MDKEEFCRITKEEGLGEYSIENEISDIANVVGLVDKNGFMVYETDERGAYHIIRLCQSESDGLEFLLEELKSRKLKANIFKKIRGGKGS